MCGIAGIHVRTPGFYGADDLKVMARALLLGIEERGRDATGFALFGYNDDGEAVVASRKRPDRAAKFVTDEHVDWRCHLKTIILHTRLATQGPYTVNVNNHPMMHKSCFVVHNGAISNDYELYYDKQLERNCGTDSAIIPVVLNERGWEEASESLAELEGTFAIAALDPVRYPDGLLLARNRWSPLVVYQTANILVWASTMSAISFAWEQAFGNKPRESKFYSFQEDEVWFMPSFDEVRKSEIPFVPAAGGWLYTGESCGWASEANTSTTNSNGTSDGGIKRIPLFTFTDNGNEFRWWQYNDTLYADVRDEQGKHVDGVVARFSPDGEHEQCEATGVDCMMVFNNRKRWLCRDLYNMEDDRVATVSAEHERLLLDFLSEGEYIDIGDSYVVSCVARDMEMSPEYINWLLTSVHTNVMENNPRLAAAFAEADRLYSEYDAAFTTRETV